MTPLAVLSADVETALGDLRATWDAICRGQSGVRPLDDETVAARVVDPQVQATLPRELLSQAKFLSGSGHMAANATARAWAVADSDRVPDERRGLYLAQMDGDDWNCRDFRNTAHAASTDGLATLDQAAANKASLRHLHPYFLLPGLKNNAFSFLASWLSLRGPNTSVAGCMTLGTSLTAMAARAIHDGALTRAVVCAAARMSGSTALFELEQQGLRARALFGTPAPLTAAAGGLVPGDAAASIVLAPTGDAPPSDIPVLLTGLASATGDGTRAGSAQTLNAAADAALAEADAAVTAIVAPGTGLPAERDALSRLATRFPRVPLTTWAGVTGHCALASDTLDVALASHALRQQTLPATYVPSGAAPLFDGLLHSTLPLPSGSSLLVLSLSVFGHAGAAMLQSGARP